MAKRFDKVYQFKLTLQGIRPPIWRRIQVPGNYSFWDLHVAIQDAMGWMVPIDKYFRCLAGERKCHPDHEEHDGMLTWVGGSYDPRLFDCEKVRFEDPRNGSS